MNIVFEYKDDPKKVVSLVQGIASYPTRSINGQRFIKATLPVEFKDDKSMLAKIGASAHHDYIGGDDLFEFIGDD